MHLFRMETELPCFCVCVRSSMSTRAVRAYRWACDVCVDAESDLIIPAWHGEMGTCDLSGKCSEWM